MTDKPSASERREWTNAPGHCHSEIGIWDSDNGDLAGKICELCKRWNEFPALTKEVAELKAERESHFALEESVLRELKAERDGFKYQVGCLDKLVTELRSGIDAFKYAADQNSIATNAWKLQAEILAKILSSINVQQIVNGLVGQELRATEITIALAEFEKFREGNKHGND